jgi:hypothetical protein
MCISGSYQCQGGGTYWWLPVPCSSLLIRVDTRSGEEVSPLCDVLLALLPSDLDLLLFATTSEIVLLQATLVLVSYECTRYFEVITGQGEWEDILALRCSIVRDSIADGKKGKRRSSSMDVVLGEEGRTRKESSFQLSRPNKASILESPYQPPNVTIRYAATSHQYFHCHVLASLLSFTITHAKLYQRRCPIAYNITKILSSVIIKRVL